MSAGSFPSQPDRERSAETERSQKQGTTACPY